MKALVLSLFLTFSCLMAAHAQEKAYRKEKMNIMGASKGGFSSQVPFSEYKTKQYLSAYLKENAKISEKRNFIEIKEVYWKQKENSTKVYAMVSGDSTQSRVWIGYEPDANEELISAIEGQMESIPFMMHKYHLQAQVKEAEDAASYLSKELKSSERDGQRLSQKLDQNAQEKIRLEQALEQNTKDKIQLEQEITNNQKTQQDKAQALQEVQQQLELLKERLKRL